MEFTSCPAQALIIGPETATKPLEPLFAHSHWALEREANLSAAMRRLTKERFPVVFCHNGSCERVAQALGNLDRPPMLIGLASGGPRKGEWIETVARNVYSVKVNRLAPSRLFPLMNHAWRACNGDKA